MALAEKLKTSVCTLKPVPREEPSNKTWLIKKLNQTQLKEDFEDSQPIKPPHPAKCNSLPKTTMPK
jgi:hypothetical protein